MSGFQNRSMLMVMKKLFAVFILIFTLQTPSQADDIRDFQIEGVNIGDSLLDYFSEEKIIGGECSTPGITSLISCCNNEDIKNQLEINQSSNILLIGCEGDADKDLYKKLLDNGKKLI